MTVKELKMMLNDIDAQRYAGRRHSADPECFGRIGIRTSHGAGNDRC